MKRQPADHSALLLRTSSRLQTADLTAVPEHRALPARARSRSIRLVAFALLLGGGTLALGQDILINDFEAPTYGSWTTTGSAFGQGPAQGALAGQNTIAGFQGHGLVTSFSGGDGSTGTLTSPPFQIQRDYVRFLMGGGNHLGQTAMNLVVNGQIVRSAVGMGDREGLDWLQWNVSALLGQTASLQIVDSSTGGWGHINVDQILETSDALPSVLTAQKTYLNIPVSFGGGDHLFELIQDGIVWREFNLHLASSNPDFYVFVDLSTMSGKDLLVRIDSQQASSSQVQALLQSDSIVTSTPIYQESLRPIYHYTAQRGYLNDLNGMVFYDGEYHACYQHNPYGLVNGNETWGNAVSTDLVHWQELPDALHPDTLGHIWSGSSVVDWNNTAGFGTQAIVSFYTEAGDDNLRMSAGQGKTQGLAYSLDRDRTFRKYPGNPIIPTVVGNNHDPRVIWYAPQNKWIMVLYLQNNDFGFFSSTDLKSWQQTSTFTFPGVVEVPDFFELALDGDPNNPFWIFYAGAGHYYSGQFDGATFTPNAGPYGIRAGNSFAAAQTFSDIPASDGRTILIGQGTDTFPGMPFNSSWDFPVELSLRTTANGPLMYVNPVKEISLLRTSTRTYPAQTLVPGSDPMANTVGEAFELSASVQPGSASTITFNLRGTNLVYDNVAHRISIAGTTQQLFPENGQIHLHILVDRGVVEIFANDGLLYMPMSVTPQAGNLPVGLSVTGSGAQLLALQMSALGSIWTTPPSSAPSISVQPAPASVLAGSSAQFKVQASGAQPLTYQWFRGGQQVAGATSSTLNLSSVAAQDAGTYTVNVQNSIATATSHAALLTIIPASPSISAQPSSVSVDSGGTAHFSVTAAGQAPLSYQWTVNGQPVSGATTTVLTLSPVSSANAGNYGVTVSNGAGTTTSNTATLTVLAAAPPTIGVQPAAASAPAGGSAQFSVSASGGFPLSYQWRRNGQPISGATANLLSLSNVSAVDAGTYDVIVQNSGGQTTSSGVPLAVLFAATTAKWSMQATTNNAPAVLDLVTADGAQPLWTFNANGNAFPTSPDSPPASMFANHNSSSTSFNAAAFAGINGALFYPQDQYGDVFSFTGSFSIEMFFKTSGNQSSAGAMQLLRQGESSFRYGLAVNAVQPGDATFTLVDRQGSASTVSVTTRNYADGTWHYVLATYNQGGGVVSVSVNNEDGTVDTAQAPVSAGFAGLPTRNDGNLLVGRYDFSATGSPRNFMGVIDEVQVTRGVLSDGYELGNTEASSSTPPMTKWTMAAAGANSPAVLDSIAADGSQNLWTFNDNANAYPTVSDAPPVGMFTNNNFSGRSFNAASFANKNGALFYPQDQYGNAFSFTGSFSVEMFFKTAGGQGGAGVMELWRQGESFARYEATLNEGNPGSVTFRLNDGQGHLPAVSLAGRSYADGTWHYILATYNQRNGSLGVTVTNEDGTVDNATISVGSFAGLPAGNDGNLLLGRNTFALNGLPRNFMGAINEVQLTRGMVADAYAIGDRYPETVPPIAKWSMAPTGGSSPSVLDLDTSDGSQNLWILSDGGNVFPSSTDTPPASMFANGNSVSSSFDSGSLAAKNGALLYPQDQYGDAFSFSGSFTVEMFFKTAGNQSGTGVMELLRQGENSFRYGLTMNDGTLGGLRFAIADLPGNVPSVSLSSRNYADGTWHYLVASYRPDNRTLALTVSNQDGSIDTNQSTIQHFDGLATYSTDGNLFLGRNSYALSASPRTFLGLISGVQITPGVVSASAKIGKQ